MGSPRSTSKAGKFGGTGDTNLNWNNSLYPEATCTGDCRGIIGTFEKFVSLEAGFEFGGPDVGATAVILTE